MVEKSLKAITIIIGIYYIEIIPTFLTGNYLERGFIKPLSSKRDEVVAFSGLHIMAMLTYFFHLLLSFKYYIFLSFTNSGGKT